MGVQEQSIERFKHLLTDDVLSNTPIMIYNTDIINERLTTLTRINNSKIYYQIKQNPKHEILKIVYDMNMNFDCQSLPEIKKVIQLFNDIDVTNRISFGNTIKDKRDIKQQYDLGVRLFATDSIEDFLNIQEVQPCSDVFIRLMVDSVVNIDDQEYPLNKKFGATLDTVIDIQRLSKTVNLNIVGLSFHVGSQNRNPQNFERQIKYAKFVWGFIEEITGNPLKLLNIGGGLPAFNYYRIVEYTPDDYVGVINENTKDLIEKYNTTIMVEPGRYVASDQQVLVSRVILKKDNHINHLSQPWIFLNVNQFQIPEQQFGVRLKYTAYNPNKKFSDEEILFTVQGMSCDSGDIFGEYYLPENVDEGDYIIIESAGQYTTAYYGYYCNDEDGSWGFNGFKPVKEIVI